MLLKFSHLRSSRLGAATAIVLCAATAAGAATVHRFSVSQGSGGSGSAATFVQNSASGSALQGEVAPSANTGIHIPFGVLGEYDASSSTFGAGILGISTTGYAVAGESLGNNPSILADAGGKGIGLEAISGATSSASAVYGEAKGGGTGGQFQADGTGYGVFGTADSAGLYGEGTNYGVEGFGLDSSTGVGGVFQGSAGLVAYSNVDAAVDGYSDVTVNENAGVSGTSVSGPGVYASSNNDIGAVVESASVNYPALVVNQYTTSGSQYELAAASGDLATDSYNFGVSRGGNVVANGSFTSGTNTFNGVTRNPGSDEMTYATQSAEATVEDVGSAQLQNGSATVALGADFAQTIDRAASYMVFISPYGETNGLYVASRTPSGFVVRENHGGRSNVAFDYRIVAHPWGPRVARLPHAPAFIRHPELLKPRSPRAAAGTRATAVQRALLQRPAAAPPAPTLYPIASAR